MVPRLEKTDCNQLELYLKTEVGQPLRYRIESQIIFGRFHTHAQLITQVLWPKKRGREVLWKITPQGSLVINS